MGEKSVGQGRQSDVNGEAVVQKKAKRGYVQQGRPDA